MPDSLILIRSGATAYDLQGRIRGSLDIPLSGEGVEEAGRVAAATAALRPVALYVSESGCAVETGRIVGAACGLAPRRVANLRNLDQGLWQGLLVDDIRRKQPRLYRQWQDNPWAVSPPEGELLDEACERVATALERICRRHAAGRVALVVPQPLDRIVWWLLAGESMGDLWARDPRPEPIDLVPVAEQWRTASRRQPQQA